MTASRDQIPGEPLGREPTPDPSGDRALRRAVTALRRRGRPVSGITPMAGDVSRRRYFRAELWTGGGSSTSTVLALYPEDLTATCERSLVSTRLLHEAGIRVPTLLEADCSAAGGGWALLEDLGPVTLYEMAGRPWSTLRPYFEAAVELLPRFADLHRRTVEELSPPLDRSLLSRELAMTREELLVPRNLDVDDGLWQPLEILCDRLGAATPVACHRDFGPRNLIPIDLADGSPAGVGVLDHQDVRLGPPLYDLASLLNDSLFPPPDEEQALLQMAGVESDGDRVRYHRAAAQRTLKAAGSYAAFAARGTERHLGLIAPTLERSLHHLAQVPETAEIAPRLARLWRSAIC